MQLQSHHHGHRHHAAHRVVLPPPDAATQLALDAAIRRVETVLHQGRMLTPGEALALAGPEARHDETLFSIARAVAWETGRNQDELLYWLEEKFPALA